MSKERIETQVTHLDGFGKGLVDPTDKYTDEEVAREAERDQQPIEDAAIVCIDTRRSADGKKEPVRRKTVGGAGMTGFVATVLSDASSLGELEFDGEPALSEGKANDVFDFVVEGLHESGVKLGGHKDNAANMVDGTGCGGRDKVEMGNEAIALETEAIKTGTQLMMEDEFNEEIFNDVVEQARRLHEIGFFRGWNSVRALQKEESLDATIETLDAAAGKRDDDPENKRKGHDAESIRKGTQHSKSNDRDNARIPGYQVDESAIEEVVAQLKPRNTLEASRQKHAAYAYNVALAFILTRNQRYLKP